MALQKIFYRSKNHSFHRSWGRYPMTRTNRKIAQQKCQTVQEAVRSALHRSAAVVMTGTLGLSLNNAAPAQSAPATNNPSAAAESQQLDEIIVTANKIAEPV